VRLDEHGFKKILVELLMSKKMNYQQIVDLGFNRNTARKMLDNLLENKLIVEEGRKTWKHGKPLWYSLSSKGYEKATSLAVNDLNQNLANVNRSLKLLDEIVEALTDSPEKMEKWSDLMHKKLLDSKILGFHETYKNGKMIKKTKIYRTESFGDWLEKNWFTEGSKWELAYELVAEEIYGPLFNVYENLQKVICKLLLPPQKEHICVCSLSDGRRIFIPEETLWAKGLIID
jgi:predicted transcriptional regulator